MKKSYFLSLLFALFFVGAHAQDVGCFRIVAETQRPICLPGETRTLTAAPPIGSVPKETTSYTVAPTTFSWRSPDNVNDLVSITSDDKWSGKINLYGKEPSSTQPPKRPFNFCFFGEKYAKCLIGDNGAVTFSIQGEPDSPAPPFLQYVASVLNPAESGSGFNFAPGSGIPFNPGNSRTTPPYVNAIMMLQDLMINNTGAIPGNAGDPTTSQINYFTTGAYPCRTFVANWQNVPLFGSCSSAGLQSYQIVLFESTNIVEIHIRRRNSCASWLDGRALIGIQNADGSVGYAPASRGNGTWEVGPGSVPPAPSEAWRFTPSGANVSVNYHWYEVDASNTVINDLGVGQTKTVSPSVETRYRVDALFGVCDPAMPLLPASDFTIIKIGEVPVNPPVDIKHCDSSSNPNQFTVGDNVATLFASTGLNPAFVEAYFYTTLADAQGNTFNNICSLFPNDAAATYTLVGGERSHTIYVNVTDNTAGCSSVLSFDVGLIDCKIDVNVCDVDNDNTQIVDLNDFRPDINASNTADGLNPADYSITFHNSATDADDVTTQITVLNPFTVIDGQDIYVRIQKIADPSSYIVKYLKVKLRPNPDVTITGTTQICAGTTAPITISGHAGAVVVYEYNSVPQPAVTIPAGGNVILTTPPVVSGNTYTYTITSATYTDTDGHVCSSPVPQSAIVTVGGLPTAAFTTTNTTICENDVITINVSGTAGTTVSYTENAGTVQSLLLDGLGQGAISMPAVLTPNTTYTYRLTKVSTTSTPPCEQTLTDVVTITVSPNPTATITQIDSQVCLGNASSVKFSGTPNSIVTYTLNTVTQPTITIPASGDITFSETLPATGVFTYELVSVAMPAPSTCSQTVTGTVAITVVGLPTATISTAIPTICSGGNTVIDFSGTPNTTVYFKINGGPDQQVTLLPSTANPAIGEGTYTSPALTAATTYQLVKVVTTGTPSCETLLTNSVLVDVKPLPTATIQANQNICTGSSTTVTVTATPNSTVTYTLNGGPATNLSIGASGTGIINTGVLTADATYRLVSISKLDGITCQSTLNATSIVRVVPLPTASFTALPNICSNRTAEITFTGTPNAQVNFTYTAGAVTTSDNVILNSSGGSIYTTIPITAITTFNLVSVVSAASGSIPSCTSNITGTLTITPVAAPLINYSVTPLEVCDDNTDGLAQVNFDLKKNDITLGNTSLVVTYHETPENARDGVYPYGPIYPIAFDASPQEAPYYVYVRVEEPGGSTCPSLTRFRVIVNRTPQAVSPAPIAVCDDSTADGYSVFPDIKVREAEMTAALYVADPRAALYSDAYAFEYYLSQPQAEAGLAAGRINPAVSFANTVAYNQTIWVRVINTSNSTLCYKVVPMQLIVRELPNVAIPAGQYSLCDDDTEDGITAFDLEDYKTQITSQPGMSVKYYFDNAAVTSGTELPMTMVDGRLQYINQVPVFQTIVVVVTNESQDTKCSIRTTITLRVLPRPFITMPAQIPTECDDDGNGSAVFDLDALKADIRAGGNYTITFHETRQNAIDNLYVYGQQVDGSGNPVLDGSGNPIPIPYPSLFNGNIWIRATDNVTGCFSVAPLQLIVNPVPTVPAGGILPQLVICDVNDDGQMRLDLRAHAEAYLLPQPVAGTYAITLHSSLIDAETPSAALIPDTNYPSTNGQIVWVRIENTVTGCYSIASFEVVINPAKYFVPKEFTICDQSLPNDGKALFPSPTGVFGDLDSVMTGGLSGYDVIYYRNVADQNALNNPIDKTVPYENESIPFQNIQVTLIDQVTGCVSISRLTLRVQPLPNPKTDPTDIEVCDNGVSRTDGIAENVDLTVNETYIRNGANPTTVAFYYYNDLTLANTDAAANAISNVGFVNAIATPTNYSGASGTIYVLMTTNPSASSPLAVKCSAMVEFELIVNPAPALGVNGVIKDFVACVVGNTGVHTFTLSDHNINVIASGLTPSDYTFTYYDSQVNAEGGTATGLLANSYTNISNPEPIWVRVVNNATTCVNVGTFNLVVDEAAVANPVPPTEPLLTTCDNDGTNDGSTAFNLTPLNDIILGTPAPANFTIHYYDNEPDYLLDLAEGVTTANTRAIPDITNYITSTKDIIALVINRTSTTGCPARVDFTLTVNKLPKVSLQDGFFCFDPITNLPLNTFALTATVDPAAGNYTFEWTKDGSPYPVTDNTTNVINVDQAGIYSVVVTDVTTGCVSVKSDDVTVSPTSTAIATASVTGYFTDNATITVIVDAASLGDYEFKLDEGQWQDSNVFSPVATGDHLVQIRDKNAGGCDEFIPLTVTVINYPKFFTPNGDGIHDKWTILGLGDEARIYIFDRYGKLVKQISSDENGGWDGTMNGQMLPSTDYWFKVEYLENDVMKEFRAHFSLKR
ncbi:T9SS type B sorting domain-containing protein [uncultured Flavobacterium sp.]|uniref:T9SS type B sorting domain-containing protein n=1 Tax=uncultured Flavobacterium sp. TaxID=165435 RepID=UPI0025F8AD14|nr:T9SS type B sorting domain-containing protein [uncultured Flavobacterium sp.]